MKKLLLMGLLCVFFVAGCGVDKETQKFADKYNKQYVVMRIALLDNKEANQQMKLANGQAKTAAALNAMAISEDFVAKYNKLKEMEKDPLYQKALDAKIIKNNYRGKTRDDLVKIYKKMDK